MKKFLALFLAVVMVLGLCAVASAEETGSVYYLNFKPEADAALQEIAALYTAETGVPVKVVTAASGTYQQTLSAEMTKSEAPTLFVIGNREALGNWDEYALDLTGTASTTATAPRRSACFFLPRCLGASGV